jgi:CHAT domain-containing protein
LEAAVASDVLVRALLLNGRGGVPATRSLAEHTVRTKRAHLGPNHADLATSLINVGDCCLDSGDYGCAIAALERAVVLRESSDASDPAGVAEAQERLGRALAVSGRQLEALRVLERSLQTKKSVLGAANAGVARTLEAIWLGFQRNGDYGEAGVAVRQAAQIQEAADPRHPAYVVTLNSLALQWLFEGNPTEAQETAARALALGEVTLRTDHPEIARTLRYQAGAALDLGDVEGARLLLDRALSIATRSMGPTHADMWMYPNDLAGTQRLLGNLNVARKLYEQSLRLAETKFGPWHDSVATSVHNLALVDAGLGDYTQARREQSRAATIWERLLGRNHPFVAIALTELATVHNDMGSSSEALPLLLRALAIRQSRLGANHPDVARTLADLAATLYRLGQMQRAQTHASRALEIFQQHEMPDAPDLASAFSVYADLQAARGEAGPSRDSYSKVIAIRQKALGRGHPSVADAQLGLAQALADLGERRSSFDTAVDAEFTARQHLRLMLGYLPERQALTYASTRPQGLDLILSLVDASPEGPATALDAAIRSRALVLDEMATRHATPRTITEETAQLYAAFTSSQQRLANLVVRGPGQLTAAQYIAAMDSARRNRERAEQNLAERSVGFNLDRRQADTGLREVTAALLPDAALVSLFRYERTGERGAAQKANGISPAPARRTASYMAFILRRNESPKAISLGPAAPIDRLVARWRNDLATDARLPATSGEARRSRLSGQTLRTLVWDPIAVHLAGAARIFLVPDGELALIPFAGLPVGPSDYLLTQAPAIHYLSAERDLVTLSSRPSRAARGLLALGGPAFNNRAAAEARRGPADESSPPAGGAVETRSTRLVCPDFKTMSFQPLSGTLQEVQDVARNWMAQGSTESNPASVLVGARASERAFKEEAPGRSVLHLATHGFFLADSCTTAPTDSRSVGGLVKASPSPSRVPRVENPLLLSGLALAGANRRRSAKPDEEDGILTAEEVASMDLRGVDWAVLSACDTGQGQIKAGEGVFGLRRAFQVAGARTVVMSLWSVDDQATRIWMKALYENRFQKHMSSADSVHAATLQVFRDRKARGLRTDPFFWAAFVAAGDWR